MDFPSFADAVMETILVPSFRTFSSIYPFTTVMLENMNKTDLKRATGISSSTLANMVAGKNVSMDVLLKICDKLQCDFSDIVEAVPDMEVSNGK